MTKALNMLSRDAILKAQDLRLKTTEVPEWGGAVFLRCPSAEEMDDWDNSITTRTVVDGKMKVTEDFRNHKARLVVKCLVDKDGERMFTDADAKQLGRKCTTAIDRLYDEVMTLAGRSKRAQKDLEGNSSGEGDSGSTSSSPVI